MAQAHLHPDITPRKLKKTRERYGSLLHPAEGILLICDGTWFGIGSNGFIFTDRGIGWTESGNSPNHCPYQAVKPDEVYNGWTGFFMQGSKKADVFPEDRKKIETILRQSLHDLWR